MPDQINSSRKKEFSNAIQLLEDSGVLLRAKENADQDKLNQIVSENSLIDAILTISTEGRKIGMILTFKFSAISVIVSATFALIKLGATEDQCKTILANVFPYIESN